MFYEYMIGVYYEEFKEYKECHGVVYVNKDAYDPYMEAHNKILKFYKDDETKICELHLSETEDSSVPIYEFPEEDFNVNIFKVKVLDKVIKEDK